MLQPCSGAKKRTPTKELCYRHREKRTPTKGLCYRHREKRTPTKGLCYRHREKRTPTKGLCYNHRAFLASYPAKRIREEGSRVPPPKVPPPAGRGQGEGKKRWALLPRSSLGGGRSMGTSGWKFYTACRPRRSGNTPAALRFAMGSNRATGSATPGFVLCGLKNRVVHFFLFSFASERSERAVLQSGRW